MRWRRIGTSVATSKTGFLPTNGGLVRARVTFDLAGDTLPPLQFSWQFMRATSPAPQPPFFFLNADTIAVQIDHGGLPTIKGLVDTLIP